MLQDLINEFKRSAILPSQLTFEQKVRISKAYFSQPEHAAELNHLMNEFLKTKVARFYQDYLVNDLFESFLSDNATSENIALFKMHFIQAVKSWIEPKLNGLYFNAKPPSNEAVVFLAPPRPSPITKVLMDLIDCYLSNQKKIEMTKKTA